MKFFLSFSSLGVFLLQKLKKITIWKNYPWYLKENAIKKGKKLWDDWLTNAKWIKKLTFKEVKEKI